MDDGAAVPARATVGSLLEVVDLAVCFAGEVEARRGGHLFRWVAAMPPPAQTWA